MRLLARYGVDTVFGIPGVHTLEFCRNLAGGPIRHVQARNEQGAGFMADGYARASGRPGVALVISGPGVTNALTPLGQSWADSIPVLLISSETASHTHGRGWGMLHEIPDQRAVTDPLTAMSASVRHADEIPGLMAEAFAVFASERPRPVHLSIPIDVAAQLVDDTWQPVSPPPRPAALDEQIAAAATLLQSGTRPVLMVGGGAAGAARDITAIAERLGAVVIASTAGKGIVPDDHPLSVGASAIRAETQAVLAEADVVLAIGTELAETDSFVDRLPLPDLLVRIDIDPAKIDDRYPAEVGIVADARSAAAALLVALDGHQAQDRTGAEARAGRTRAAIRGALTDSQQRHTVLLDALRTALGEHTIFMGDICQLVYTGCFAMPVAHPRLWSYPAGYCTLGCGVPNAIGAKLALPDRDVVCLVGDGGLMFTVQELIVGAELGLGIPVVVWDNAGLKQIRDDMAAAGIEPVGVDGQNPDFMALAEALRCNGVESKSLEHAVEAVAAALGEDRPTIITVREDAPWLAAALAG